MADDVLRAGGRYATTLRAVAYPPAVTPGWLRPVLRAGVDVDLAIHVSPEDSAAALDILRRQHGRMASTVNLQEEGGDLADPHVSGAASDAERLHEGSGPQRDPELPGRALRHRVGGRRGPTGGRRLRGDREGEGHQPGSAAGRLRTPGGLGQHPATGARPGEPDLACDTQALATALPVFTGEAESDPAGSLVGFHAISGAPVFVDRFRLDGRRSNAHKLSVAPTGRGKSYEIHQECVSLLLEQVAVRVVDFENEYIRMAEALGGTVVRLGVDGARINCFELAEAGDPGAVTRQALFVEALLATLLGSMTTEEEAQLARAIIACYRLAGITADPATHGSLCPELLDLHAALEEAGATALADRLEAWTVGAQAGLLSGQTSVHPDGELVVWALGDLPAENERLQAAAVLLVVHAIWTEIARQDRRRRVVILDEAWRIYETSAAAGRILEGLARRLAKGARKYNAGLTNATQDLVEFENTSLGKTILNNSAIKWLPGQEEGAVREVAETFGLTEAERKFVAGCSQGHGLFMAGRQRVRIEVRATPIEHRLATSNPEEIAGIDRQEIRRGAEMAIGGYLGLLAGAGGEAAGVATGSALTALPVAARGRRPGPALACRHRIADVEGDWMAGRATAGVELTWSDGAATWGEWVRLDLVRTGRQWLVAEGPQDAGGGAMMHKGHLARRLCSRDPPRPVGSAVPGAPVLRGPARVRRPRPAGPGGAHGPADGLRGLRSGLPGTGPGGCPRRGRRRVPLGRRRRGRHVSDQGVRVPQPRPVADPVLPARRSAGDLRHLRLPSATRPGMAGGPGRPQRQRLRRLSHRDGERRIRRLEHVQGPGLRGVAPFGGADSGGLSGPATHTHSHYAAAHTNRRYTVNGQKAPAPGHMPGLAGIAARLRELGSLLRLGPTVLWIAAWAGAGIVVAAAAALVARRCDGGAAWPRWPRAARGCTLMPPPEIDPASARTFWAALHLRSKDAPWIVWHFQATSTGMGVWAWVPDVVPADGVRRAIEGSWPGARTEEGRPDPVEAPVLPSRRAMRAGAGCLAPGAQGSPRPTRSSPGRPPASRGGRAGTASLPAAPPRHRPLRCSAAPPDGPQQAPGAGGGGRGPGPGPAGASQGPRGPAA